MHSELIGRKLVWKRKWKNNVLMNRKRETINLKPLAGLTTSNMPATTSKQKSSFILVSFSIAWAAPIISVGPSEPLPHSAVRYSQCFGTALLRGLLGVKSMSFLCVDHSSSLELKAFRE